MPQKQRFRAVTREVYDRLVDAYRERPGVYSFAAREADVDPRTAKKAWDQGWAKHDTWAIPIRDYLSNEREQIRAERLRLEEAERAKSREDRRKAREDVVRTKAIEAQLTAATRGNAAGISRVAGQLILAAIPVAEKLKNELENQKISPVEAGKVLRDVAYFNKIAQSVGLGALQMERLRLGEPVDQQQQGMGISITEQEALDLLEGVSRTAQRARLYGGFDADGELPDEAYAESEEEDQGEEGLDS